MTGQIIAVATGKGGVGKTSVVAAVAGILARHRHRVAIIELDPQGDLADDLGQRDALGQDDGAAVARAILTGTSLGKGIAARPHLTYHPGGAQLEQTALLAASRRSDWGGFDSKLRSALDRLTASHDLVLIDTPPTSEALQRVSLSAADWLLIPTAVDTSSLRALFAITSRLVEVEPYNPGLRLLGVALWNVPSSATRIRAEVRTTLDTILGDTMPLLETTIRSAIGSAYECRQRGILPHELADAAGDAEPFWKALAEGRTPERVPTSAQALAGDYAHLANEILVRIRESA